ncbi:hypothetical protein [Paenibacillus sp. 598K]|uniref:hypothetical protein n=1 Tax=Paenibacillus sp. 598K TaxID=1117987 RepID=UPI0021AA152A|nr:hypothetical protein [Paenibacillus sp. 598K]
MTGPTGPTATFFFADFYALMPTDNPAPIAVGDDVAFPNDGPASGAVITRTDDTTFNLSIPGTYQVYFQVGVTESGQLVLTLNDAELLYTVAGRIATTSQIIGTALVQTSAADQPLTVRNPAGNPDALTITNAPGGTQPVSAHLIITLLT